jgi:signal transduction histidine kinase
MERRIPPWVADAAIALGLFALAVASLRDLEAVGVSGVYSREAGAFAIVLIALQTLPLAVRRRFPVTVLAIVTAAFMVDRGFDYPSTFAGVGTIVAIHAVGSELPPRTSAIAGLSVIGVVTAYTVLGSVLYESVGPESVVFVLISGLMALYLGREVNHRREATRTLEQRAERAEREREERARAAVAEERARIARELHDVVAHEIVVMTVQAEGAARIAGDADPRIRGALETIRDTGREGLAEMRRMVGLLREPNAGGPLTPQPGLAQLDALTGQFEEAGLPVTLEISGRRRHLSGGVDLNAYRIVQESLTNALKHGGPGVTANVLIDYGDDHLDIRVVDDGRGAAASLNGGHGLVGMRERVALLGGELHTGPHVGGGFEVHASLPVGR